MKQINIADIINYLKNVIAINAIVWDRIYFWLPITDDQQGTYITINILWEQQAFLNKWTLLEFRFIAHDTNTTFNSLLSLKNIVSNELFSKKELIDFNVYNCYEENGFKNGYDEKNRKVIIQDYRFYFIT